MIKKINSQLKWIILEFPTFQWEKKAFKTVKRTTVGDIMFIWHMFGQTIIWHCANSKTQIYKFWNLQKDTSFGNQVERGYP